MIRAYILSLLMVLVTTSEAKAPAHSKKPLVEVGGKVNLFLSNATAVGLGAEVVVNPFRRLGLRYEFFDVRYQDPVVTVSLLSSTSSNLDALIYLPMPGIEPYIHAGIGLSASFGGGSSQWIYGFRCGMGLNYSLTKRSDFFAETGVLFNDATGVDAATAFRLSAGVRLGLMK